MARSREVPCFVDRCTLKNECDCYRDGPCSYYSSHEINNHADGSLREESSVEEKNREFDSSYRRDVDNFGEVGDLEVFDDGILW